MEGIDLEEDRRYDGETKCGGGCARACVRARAREHMCMSLRLRTSDRACVLAFVRSCVPVSIRL